LITRHWRITDGRGHVSFVDGEGVVGEQPRLEPGQAHDYVSGCPLGTPNGSMEGHYTMRRDDGSVFDVAIPFFRWPPRPRPTDAAKGEPMKRTHLPLNGLRVLDAAARHLSFTRAADELAVTPAAVGQQIRALEDLLGVVLFRRTSKGLELTDEAAAGLDAIREGFLRFEEGVQAMQAGQSSHVYTIACPRDFFAAWFSQRLAAFRAENPALRFSLVGGDGDIDFTEANLDLAVRWAEGPGELEGFRWARRGDRGSPVAAPAVWGRRQRRETAMAPGSAGRAIRCRRATGAKWPFRWAMPAPRSAPPPPAGQGARALSSGGIRAFDRPRGRAGRDRDQPSRILAGRPAATVAAKKVKALVQRWPRLTSLD
jgi:DNA-binding transcriptional LysR family regulator